jgi:hypothetical protein
MILVGQHGQLIETGGLESLLQPELEQIKAIRDGKVLDDVEIKQKYLFSIFKKDTLLDFGIISTQ